MPGKNPSKSFKLAYKLNIFLILLLVLWAIIYGLTIGEEILSDIWFTLVFTHIVGITPLLIPFLLLNLYGVFRYEEKRASYLIVSTVSVLLICSGIYLFFNITLP